jgi:hypothetical protein
MGQTLETAVAQAFDGSIHIFVLNAIFCDFVLFMI